MEQFFLELRRSSSSSSSADGSNPAVGAIVASVGNFLISLSFQLQKIAHRRNESSETIIHYTRLPLWWAGMALMGIGEVGNFFAYGLAPASLISPLGAVAVISNCILARTILKEKLTYRNILGVFFALGGAMLVILFAPRSISSKSADEGDGFLYDMLVNLRSGIYLLCVLLLAGYVANPCISRFAISERQREKNVVFFVLLCGLFGIVTVMSAKGVSLSVKSLLVGDFVPFTGAHCWLVYLLIFGAIVSIIMQMKYLNKAMMGFGAQQVVPVYYVTFTLSTISAGMVLYLEVDFGEWWKSFLFGCGIIITFMGVWLINQKFEEEGFGLPEAVEGLERFESSSLKPNENEMRKFSGKPHDAQDVTLSEGDWSATEPKNAMCVLLEKEVASCSDFESNRDDGTQSDPLGPDFAPSKAEVQIDDPVCHVLKESPLRNSHMNPKMLEDYNAASPLGRKRLRIIEHYAHQAHGHVDEECNFPVRYSEARLLRGEQRDVEADSFQLTIDDVSESENE